MLVGRIYRASWFRNRAKALIAQAVEAELQEMLAKHKEFMVDGKKANDNLLGAYKHRR
ncbi:hypothetical protein VIS19158_18466 [Vibrio scophthalmi LMG 19158]|uniref:Uncharacterized protein n=1 Tax=Vibrio scophthalmi LMG 19158 TaxID=870967 RepID=F9RKN0_9VIBR|nr:hypothetical protein VIS19158_18466 [Vibrio scophthalmi LMG 19158]